MRRGERDVEWRCAGGGGGEGEAPRAGGDSAAVEQRRLAAAAAGERLYGEEGAGRRRALEPQPAVSLPAAVPDLFGECTEVRAGEMVSRRASEHCANTRATNAASAAEYGRMRRETCPLERQLEWMSSYSASRHEICGDTGRFGEIWGGYSASRAPDARCAAGAAAKGRQPHAGGGCGEHLAGGVERLQEEAALEHRLLVRLGLVHGRLGQVHISAHSHTVGQGPGNPRISTPTALDAQGPARG